MPAPKPTLPLGPWRGINNVSDELSQDYAVIPDPLTPAYLREAVNVDLTRDGWIKSRVGRVKLATLTDAHSLTALNSGLYFVDDGAIKKVRQDGSTETLVTGLNNSLMSFTDLVGGDVFYCNGTDRGRIAGGVGTFWGLTPPNPPALSATTGNLHPGRYLVAVTCESADGVESGSRAAVPINLPAGGGISVAQVATDSNAAYVNLYVTSVNGDDLFWANRVATGSSYLITDFPQSTDLLQSMQMYRPPAGASICRNFKGRMLVAVDNVLYWSQPLAPHWFKLSTDLQLFAEEILLLEPVADGFYLAEGERTWWVSGDDPHTWSPTLVDDSQVASGNALRIPGRKIPALETTDIVVVWATASGPAVGLPKGQVAHLTDRTVAMDAHSNATLTYREENGIAQILMGLRRQQTETKFGATDRAFCTVTKANLASD